MSRMAKLGIGIGATIVFGTALVVGVWLLLAAQYIKES